MLLGRERSGFRAMPLLVKIIGPVEFENEVAVNRGRIARRIVGAGAAREAFDHRICIGAVKEGDRITVGARLIQNAVRRRQKAVVRPAPHDVAEIDQKRPGNDRRREPFAGRQPYCQSRHIGARQGLLLDYLTNKGKGRPYLTLDDLADKVAGNGNELYYRLEQLRLLGFVNKMELGDADGVPSFGWALSEGYRRDIGR